MARVVNLWYYFYVLIFMTILFNCVLAEAYSFFRANLPLPYFQAKRENLLRYAAAPKSLDENRILFFSPLQRSLPGVMMPIRSEHYNNFQQEYASSNSMPYNSISAPKSLQQLFGMTKLRKNQLLRKIRDQSIQNSVEKNVLSRKKRLHGLSLLRNYKGKSPVLVFNNHVVKENEHDRQKRLHSLSRLRGYNNKPEIQFLQYKNNKQQENVLSRPKRLHSLALLRGFSNKADNHLSQYNNKEQQKSVLSRPKRLHSLSLLRGYSNKPENFFSHYENNDENKNVLSRPKRLHSMSLLRSYSGKLKMPLYYNNNNNVEISTHKQQRVRRRSKRVHNLSLLRYDGKLFQNLFGTQVAPDLSSDLQQKRFEKKQLISKLQNKFRAMNRPTYYYFY